MLQQIIDHANPAAPLMSRPRFAFQVQQGAYSCDIAGENRLGFGAEVISGFTYTGCEAHAAVRMHVTPAIASPWSKNLKGKAMATTPSAGMLRRS